VGVVEADRETTDNVRGKVSEVDHEKGGKGTEWDEQDRGEPAQKEVNQNQA